MENKFCLACIEKYWCSKSTLTLKNCRNCKEIPSCSLCKKFRDEETTFSIYNLNRKYLRVKNELRSHRKDIQDLLIDIDIHRKTLSELRRGINDEDINIDDIRQIIQDFKLDIKNFLKVSCIKTVKLSDYEPNKDFLPKKTVYESTATIWNAFCYLCGENFDENSTINLLSCGHSLCLKCLPKPVCPDCQANIKIITGMKENLVQYVEYLNKKIIIIKSELDNHLNELNNLVSKAENSILVLKALWDDFYANKTRVEFAKSIISAYEVYLNAIDIEICKLSKSFRGNYPILLDRDDSLESKNAFLHKVYYLLKNGQSVYGMSTFEFPVKYGTFSFEKSVILFHAIHLEVIENSANYVTISDLKLALNHSNYFPFMIIRCNEDNFEFRFMMRLYDTQLSIQFIKLCIGEFEASYKNSSYVKGDESNSFYESILHVPMYVRHECETLGALELFSSYDKDLSELYEYKTGDLFLKGKLNGSFSICRSLSDSTKVKSFGVVQKLNEFNNINYKDSKHLKIIDCGLQIMHL
ncbi:hypothetical protein Avbf_05414 [Armadillidium vulgare]|nr:hypothetical protein Avbf_05414 [Armadillidium vulgare]